LLPHPPERPNRRDRERHRSRRVTRLALIASAVVVVAAGAGVTVWALDDHDDDTAAAQTGTTIAPSSAASTTTTAAPTTTLAPTTTTLPTMPDPPFVELPEVDDAGIGQGTTSEVVLAYEQRLKSLQFDPGEVDGEFDQATRYAVEALEKLAGLPRNGRIGPAERLYLMAFKYPAPLTGIDREAKRVEIDLDRQLLTVYSHHLVVLITTTSTGDGDYFCGGDDGCQYAITPAGKYAFTWRYPGWRQGKLGRLYNPVYFNGGIAVHGYSSVPTEPASHGCARIPMHVAEYFPSLVDGGDPVYVIGTPAAPEGGGGGTTATTAPATTAPTTAAPTTTAPTTAAPTTTAPTTVAPTTAAPTTTVTIAPPTTIEN
jgi:peptidoglycan hydrolase-like protein with peptidoglycan-binding domain